MSDTLILTCLICEVNIDIGQMRYSKPLGEYPSEGAYIWKTNKHLNSLEEFLFKHQEHILCTLASSLVNGLKQMILSKIDTKQIEEEFKNYVVKSTITNSHGKIIEIIKQTDNNYAPTVIKITGQLITSNNNFDDLIKIRWDNGNEMYYFKYECGHILVKVGM